MGACEGARRIFGGTPLHWRQVTTGAPIYLVSACTSGEEFISAFRRYADRNGVIFIPIAEPLPAGRRGRFALSLSNGGVMVEGQAEVVSSARTPSVLYGRVGMTVKFLSPDEPSQTILSELEKARTSLKPPAPSVPPRAAEIPAEPRSKPPTPGGRIDAVNALAECVLIGDVSTLSRDSDLGTIPPPTGTTPSGPTPVPIAKAPSAPTPAPIAKAPSGPTPAPIAKAPSGPTPAPKPPTLTTTMPPPFKPATKPAAPSLADRAKTGSIPPAVPPLPATIGKATTMGMPALDRKPSGSIPAPAAPGSPLNATTLGMPALRPAATTTPAPNAPPPPAKPLAIAAPPPPIAPSPPVPATREEAVAAALKFAQAVEARGAALPDETVKGSPPGVALLNETIRGTLPANALVASPPPPIQYPTADDSDEKTDLTNIPPVPERRTEIGIAVTPSGAHVLPSAPERAPTDEETRETSQMEAARPANPLDEGLTPVEQVDPLGSTQAAIRLSKLQPTIEEPSGDWTLSTNDGSMTILPRKPAPDANTDEPAPPKGPPTGDYIIALDPSRPDGWSEPSKVEKPPEGELPPGPPVSTVASDKPLDSNARTQPEITQDEPKIQIDPTLIEPLQPMPADDAAADDDLAEPPPAMPPPPTASTPMLPLAAPPPSQQMLAQPGAVPILPVATTPGMGPLPITPPRPQLASASGASPAIATAQVRGDVTDGGVGFFRESGDIPRLATNDEMSRAAQKRKRRMIVIVASAAAAVLLAVIAIVLVTRKGDGPAKPTTAAPPPTTEVAPPAPEAPPKIEAAPPKVESVAPVTPETPEVKEDEIQIETPTAQEAIADAPTDCSVTITSVPAGAEIHIGGEAKGAAPVTVTLPCGVGTKVTVKKARYQTSTREVTPKPNGKPIKIALARSTFTVKVSSSPPGASVKLNGKTLGMTPTTVKVPAFESSTLRIAKDGYAPETAKVTPKNNASSVSVTLKKTVRAPSKRK